MEAVPSSVQERIKARIAAKQQTRYETLPVQGFDDMLEMRVRALTYRELKAVGRKNADLADEDQMEVMMAADLLANACEDVILIDGEERRSLGPWGQGVAQALALPAQVTTGRQCVLALMVDELDLMANRDTYLVWRDGVAEQAAKEALGKLAEASPTS